MENDESALAVGSSVLRTHFFVPSAVASHRARATLLFDHFMAKLSPYLLPEEGLVVSKAEQINIQSLLSP